MNSMTAAGRQDEVVKTTGRANFKTSTNGTVGSADQDAKSGSAIENELRERIGQRGYDRYFDGQTRLAISGDRIRVLATSRFTADAIASRFGEAIETTARGALGRDASVSIEVDTAPTQVESRRGTDQQKTPARLTAARQSQPRRDARSLRELVVGSSNRMALDAAKSLIAAGGGAGMSPLVAHGPCGVGKTHLLRGLVNDWREAWPGRAARYTTADAFMTEYVSAVRTGRVDTLQAKLRSLRLLAIDDVHFLANKAGTQTELLHTLDALERSGAAVVFASDAHPHQIKALSTALTSRLIGGAVVRMETPDEAMTPTLVRTLAIRRGLELTEGAIDAIVHESWRLASGREREAGVSVRDLEGLIVQLLAMRRASGPSAAIDRGSVMRAVGVRSGASAPTRAAKPIRIDDVIAVVCDGLGVTLSDLCGTGRRPAVVLGRALSVLLGKKLTGRSFPEIATALARTSHSTVATAHKRVTGQIAAGEIAADGMGWDGVSIAEIAERFEERIRRL